MTKHNRFYREGFENVELTLDEMAEVINLGCTISYQYLDGIRKTENFIGTEFLAVDVDDGMTLQEASENPIFKKYCSIQHVTPNHNPDHHRFRLIFTLPRKITKIAELRAAAISLTKRFGGDLKATDPARIFHGHKDSFPQIFNQGITDDFLEELITDGKTQPSSESIVFAGSTTTRSDYQPEPSRIVRTSAGVDVALESIKSTTSIYCPFHDDRNPSAFVAHSPNGSQFIHCSSCQISWHVKGTSLYEKKFEDFDHTIRRIKENQSVETFNDSPLQDLLVAQNIPLKNITITENEHLEIRGLEDGLTLIKSPKGTGKTTYLADVLGKIIRRYATLEAYEEDNDFESEKAFFSKEKVLLIGHRQALIGDLCKRLSLNSYLDDSKTDTSEVRRRKSRYGVCLDSLHKVRGEKYDIIVIDEVEQVLSHFLSETIGEKRRGLFIIFCELLQNAKKIVALDADLGWISYITLSHLTRNQKKDPTKIQVFINDWQPKNKELLMYGSIYQLIHEIKKNVVNGKRIFITANSKSKIKALTHSIKSLEKELGISINTISITSENSGSQEIQHFIRNIKTEILNYQVILSSPSLGTGIDISFDNGKQEVDAVFGIFENQINTHFEIDQQLARVRNPGSVHVWVSPRIFNFETDFRIAAKDFLHRHLLDVLTTGYLDGAWDIQNADIDPFIRMAALIVSHQRASKNRLRSNFLQYRKDQGWAIKYVQDDETLQKEGKDLFQIGKDVSENEWRTAILNANTMNRIEFSMFKEELESNTQTYTNDQWYAFYKTRLELFYGETVTDQLLKYDRKGALRREITLFEDLAKLDDVKFEGMYKTHQRGSAQKDLVLKQKLFRDRHSAIALLYGLLSTTPVFNNGVFDSKAVFVVDDLKKFAKASIQLKEIALAQLEVNTQSDVEQKAVQHLGKILSKIGLGVKKVNQSTTKGKKTYSYSLDSDSVNRIQQYSQKRGILKNGGWDFVDSQYDFKYSDIELEWLDSRLDHQTQPI
jgi:hypothetical protein